MPVTDPLAATFATATSEEDQMPPACALAKVVEDPSQTAAAPVMAVNTGFALTFTFNCTAVVHPLAFVTLYVIVVAPLLTPVSKPAASIVAALVFDEDHVPAIVAFVSVVVPPSHTALFPAIACTTGAAKTVIFVFADVAEQPLPSVIVTE